MLTIVDWSLLNWRNLHSNNYSQSYPRYNATVSHKPRQGPTARTQKLQTSDKSATSIIVNRIWISGARGSANSQFWLFRVTDTNSTSYHLLAFQAVILCKYVDTTSDMLLLNCQLLTWSIIWWMTLHDSQMSYSDERKSCRGTTEVVREVVQSDRPYCVFHSESDDSWSEPMGSQWRLISTCVFLIALMIDIFLRAWFEAEM